MLKEEDFSFDDETILATYEGHTIFSIFLYKMEVYEKILESIEKREFEEELDIYQKPAENSFLKRLYRIISMPTDDLKVTSAQLVQEPEFNCHACVLDKSDQHSMHNSSTARSPDSNVILLQIRDANCNFST